MATIVDSLIVTLGLDPSDFKKGQKEAADALIKGQKSAQKSVKETDIAVSKGAKEMGKAITATARQFAVAFLGFSGAAGFTKFMANLNNMARSTKMTATNLGMSATALKNWTNTAELAGASAESMAGFLTQIQEQQYQQKTTGLPGWVKELRSMGLDLFDGDVSKWKDETEVILQLADAFAKLREQQGVDTAVQRFRGMGIDPAEINLLARGRDWIASNVARQRARYGDNEGTFNGADKLSQNYTDLKQRFEDFFLKLLAKLQPFISGIFAKIDSWLANMDMGKLASQMEQLTMAVIELAGDILDFVSWLRSKSGVVQDVIDHPGKSFADWTKRKTKELRSQPEVDAIIDDDPVLWKLRSAVASNFSDNFPKSIGSLVDSASGGDEAVMSQLLTTLTKVTGKGVDDTLDKAAVWKIRQAVQDIARSRLDPAATTGSLGNTGAAQAAQGAGASAAVAQVGGGRSFSSTVQVDTINVYGVGGDGRQIAGGIERELQRKQLIAQGDYGLA